MSLFREGVRLRCVTCGSLFPPNPRFFTCRSCGGLLEVVTPVDSGFEWGRVRARRFGVWRYRELLPLAEWVNPVSLGEGGTPLVRVDRAADPHVFVKFEGSNPTGSFKDRGMTVGVTIAKGLGVEGVVVASTGNTAASAAAYAARAGLRCLVYLPRGGVARGKLAQALLHGAEVVEVEGFFDDALELVLEEYVERSYSKLYPLNSVNPWRLEGQKTLAFELVDELGNTPDVVVVPVGNAGNISAIWKGFRELRDLGVISGTPRMIGVQATGAAPLAKTWSTGSRELQVVEEPRTIASAIRIGRPVNWVKALKAVEESRGALLTVSDEEILEAIKMLARLEGLGVEPSSAASLAGYLKALEEGLVDRGETVVLVATGHALKDPDIVRLLVEHGNI
ncbi:MAG: threonine synthase [Desulfurococcaceae archaeon]|nr:threonine synthase [Desulfurococcaceae archaeon]